MWWQVFQFEEGWVLVAETSRRSDCHYGVQGGRSKVVLFGLNAAVWGFELISSRSHDMVVFQNKGIVLVQGGCGVVWGMSGSILGIWGVVPHVGR
jgi:hypothetical protein